MKPWKLLIGLTALCCFAVLTGCGTLTIEIEMAPTHSEKTNTPALTTEPGRPSPTAATTHPAPAPTTVVPTDGNTSPAAGPLNPGSRVKILQTKMLNTHNGWGIGEVEGDPYPHILLTEDGGKTWLERTPQKQIADAPAEGLAVSSFFMTANDAWAAYGSQAAQSADNQLVIWHTQDGGRHWTQSQTLNLADLQQESRIPSDLGFIDAQHGWLLVHLGAGMSHDYFAAFITADGGKNWQRVIDPEHHPEMMSCYKSGLTFMNPNSGWLIGDCPGLMPKLFLYHTDDGGQRWTEAELPVPDERPANFFAQTNNSCGIPAVEYSTPATVKFMLSCTNLQSGITTSWLYNSNGGGAWSIAPLPEAYGKLDFISPDEGWMAASTQDTPSSSGEIYHTIDGGHTWSPLVPTGWNGTPDFIDSLTGWVIARQGDQVALVITDNGGKDWNEIKPVIGP